MKNIDEAFDTSDSRSILGEEEGWWSERNLFLGSRKRNWPCYAMSPSMMFLALILCKVSPPSARN
jgi:hypothetical protein